jgi:hypothetical protein
MGDEEKNVDTSESTDTQEVDINDLIDTGEETDDDTDESTKSDTESTDTDTDDDDTGGEEEGTLLPEDLQEKYGIKTEEELAEKLKKADNADKVVNDQGRELGELRKLKEEVDAIKAKEAETSEANAQETFNKKVEDNFKKASDLVQKALTDESFKKEDIGQAVVGALAAFMMENLIYPTIDDAIYEFENRTKASSDLNEKVKTLTSEIVEEFPKIEDKESPLYKKAQEIMDGINPALLKNKENALTLLKIATRSAAAALKGDNIPNADMNKAIKKIEEKESGKVLTRKKTPAPAKKDDIEDLISTKSGASGADYF